MKKLFTVLTIFLLIILASFLWWQNGISAVDKNNKTEVTFVVGKGENVREVANSLKKENLIKDPIAFFLLVRFQLNLDNKIQAGDHRLSQSMNAQQLAKALTLASNDIWVTIPEGLRAEEIADIFQKEIPSYEDSWRNALQGDEGYLFPDTYLIPRTADIKLILSVFNKNFNQKYANLTTDKTQNEIVTVASLVEREAKYPEDRPLVASVIYNRLGIGMGLNIDATVQYALGYQTDEKRWWKKNLTVDDLRINSPYNTYLHAGLPPTPIANPGLASLKGAANPAQTNYLYYISDKTGKNHYAETIEQQNANIKKYGL